MLLNTLRIISLDIQKVVRGETQGPIHCAFFNFISATNYWYTLIGGVDLILNEIFTVRVKSTVKNNLCDTYCTLFSRNYLLISELHN